MTLASHPGADRHHQHRRRQHPPPLHHRRRRSCQEDARAVCARAAAGAGRAPGRPDPGRGRGWRRSQRGGGQSRPTAATGRAGGGGGGWGSLSPQFRTPRAAGRSSLSGRMSSGSPPLSSPWGSSVEALKTGGRGPSSARRAPRHLCDLAERGAVFYNMTLMLPP
ncbi:forkhead box protein D1-like isoform X2 [Lontra canadensis]|uniref:forkhead box protein D1-like isoform X2 n=1 Tax=Lontra canadensis TaxID=76717 RepID=UPI0013F2F217|nr:forkhead box protein D1-like isoform X2 [Lontra canadensis]